MKMYQSFKNKGKKIFLIGSIIPIFLFGKMAKADEAKTLEKKIFSNSKIELNFNSLLENEQRGVEYSLLGAGNGNDGRRFFDFVGYDETPNSLKKELSLNEPLIQSRVDYGNYTKAVKLNLLGVFMKEGKVRGDEFSSTNEMTLIQMGYKRNFLIPNKTPLFHNAIFGLNLSFLFGGIHENGEENLYTEINGFSGNLIFDTNNKTGFNFRFMTGGINSLFRESGVDFSDFATGTKVSYKALVGNVSVEPYEIFRGKSSVISVRDNEKKITSTEYGGGVVLGTNLFGKVNVSTDFSYLQKMLEEEYVVSVGFRNKRFEINGKWYSTKSDYEFCPNKQGYGGDINVNFTRFKLGAGYKKEVIDYNGKKERQKGLSFKVAVKL